MGKLLARPGFRHQRDPLAVGFLLVCAAIFAFFVYTPYFGHYEEERLPTRATWGWHTTDPNPDPSIPRSSFRDLALQFGSLDLTSHKYHFMYEKYLPSIRDRPVKLLKIGLGCDDFTSPPQSPQEQEPEPEPNGDTSQDSVFHAEDAGSLSSAMAEDSQGESGDNDQEAHQEENPALGRRDGKPVGVSTVGSSYHILTTYFSKLSLTYIERNAECTQAFTSRHDKALVFIGSRRDEEFLERFSRESTVHGLFDVIIDGEGAGDEGEKDDLQVRGMRNLWRIVRPGGVYFIEGIQGDVSNPSFGKFVDELLWGDVMIPDAGEVRSIDCMDGICAFFKKDEGTS